MALCLAESLLAKNGFDAADQMGRYLDWWQWGYLSSTGECFDIGMTVLDALTRYQETRDPFAGSTDPYTAGNGPVSGGKRCQHAFSIRQTPRIDCPVAAAKLHFNVP
jgi:hypothetical protein